MGDQGSRQGRRDGAGGFGGFLEEDRHERVPFPCHLHAADGNANNSSIPLTNPCMAGVDILRVPPPVGGQLL
jgi:hypothetical protein